MSLLETRSDALRLHAVRKDFGPRHALEALSLAIAPGEVYALLGPNGAGKTTTLNLILGFLAPESGHIDVAGTRVDHDPLAARAKIAYLPETVMLHPTLDAIENLLPAGHQSLGTHLDVGHYAATPVGMTLRATAEVANVDGRNVTFRVEAFDDRERIGDGTHGRVVVNVERFDNRIQRKLKGEA